MTQFKMDKYWISRDFHTSARFHLQHWLVQSTLGFALHPSIVNEASQKEGLRVADLACGNGAWLFDVARLIPNADLQGYDITDSHFPATPFLPKGVSLNVLNVVTDELPADLIGTFDVVHIRAAASIISRNNTDPILNNVSKLLKPGGWLQWDEAPPNQITATAPREGIEKSASQQFVALMQKSGEWTGIQYDWINDLTNRLSAHGFENTEQKFIDCRPEQYKAWTENYLIVYEELEHSLLTKAEYQSRFDEVVEETRNGVVLQQQSVMVAIGQKKA